MNDIQREIKVAVIAAIILVVCLVALTLVGAVVGPARELMCRIVPIVLFCVVVLATVVGVLWLIGRIARLLWEAEAVKRVYTT